MCRVEIAVLLVALAVAVLAFTALAGRLDVPAPLLLIAVGVVASYVPGVPEIHLEPEVVLLGLLPPLLYAAAIQTSLVDFNANRRAILLLSVGLVVFTTVGVGALVHALIPGISWPVAFAIGAVVAPPDAVAATAIARRIGLPRRIVTILEGESLLNDATALVALRTAIAADVGRRRGDARRPGLPHRRRSAACSIGFVVFVVVAKLRKLITDPVLDTAISFVVPFGAYIAAEEIHASGVIAVVVAGLLLGHKAPIVQTAQSRIAERMNWRTIAFVLENTVFLLIGLQAGWILEDVADSTLVDRRGSSRSARRRSLARDRAPAGVGVPGALPAGPPGSGSRPPGGRPPWTVHVHPRLGGHARRGHAGRGLRDPRGHRAPRGAAAHRVHGGGRHAVHPGPDAAVARPPAAACPSPDPMEDALARATLLQQASKAGFKELRDLEYDDPHGVVELIKQRIEQRNFAAWERLGTHGRQETPASSTRGSGWPCSTPSAARVLEIRSAGQRRPRGRQRGAGDARRRGVDDRHRLGRAREELETEYVAASGVPAPRAPTSTRTRPSRRSSRSPRRCASVPRRAATPGCRCGSASTAATSAAATPR